MWSRTQAPARLERAPSAHNVESVYLKSRTTSMSSFPLPQQEAHHHGYDSDQSSDTAAEEDFTSTIPLVSHGEEKEFAVQHVQLKAVPAPLKTQLPDIPYFSGVSPAPFIPDLSKDKVEPGRLEAATLSGGDDKHGVPDKILSAGTKAIKSQKPGPLEMQLAALMTKIVFMEQNNPDISVSREEYDSMSRKLQALEEEKKSWTKRHEAIWKLRDEDVENNIKIRGLLAKTRHDLDGMTKLRDDDLLNLQAVRAKLAEATRQLEKLQGMNARSSPARGRPASTYMDRRQTTDLFAVAKAAALEQRALELEKRNSDLLTQLENLKGGADADASHRVGSSAATEEKAEIDKAAGFKTNAKAKDVETLQSYAFAPSQSKAAAPLDSVMWHRLESLHEEHASYRELMGRKLQTHRSEIEQLQATLHNKEDECHALETQVRSLQRRLPMI